MTLMEEAAIRKEALDLAIKAFDSAGSTQIFINVAQLFECYLKTGDFPSEEKKTVDY